MATVIEQGSHVAVLPQQVNLDKDKGFTGFWNTFGSCENENVAAFLVFFAQKRRSWDPFTMSEYENVCIEADAPCFSFDGLIRTSYIVRVDGTYHFTYEFVGRVYGASPTF